MFTNTSGRSDDSNSTQTRAKRSKVWEHFEQNLVKVDSDFRVVCKYCRMQITIESGTTSLITHISQYCHAIGEADRNRFIATLKKPLENFVFDPQFSRERMIDFIIHAEIPFNKFEDPYFEPWVKSMQPTLSGVGQQIVRIECLKKYHILKQDIQNELESLDSHVCLTSDLWTSIQNLGYMVVTAHYITPDFKKKKKIISFREVKYPHSGFAINEALVSCLTEWGIQNKVFTLTLDNASNNSTACDLLVDAHKYELMFEGAHLHVRCCAHILNILVQDGLKIIHEEIKKIRELLKHIISSPLRFRAFNKIAVVNGLPTKRGIVIDIPKHWNSTLKMLREAIKYKTVLNSYANQHAEISPSEEEWSIADSICKFLKTFKEATKAISVDRKPTSYLFLPLIVSIRDALDNPSWQTSVALQDLAATMRIKFEKYWGRDFDESNQPIDRRNKKDYDVNIGIVIATMLDPRGKAEYAEFFYQKIYSNIDQVNSSVNAAQVWMKKYFMEYEQRLSKVSAYSAKYSSEENSSVGSPVFAKRQLGQEFANFKSNRRNARSPKSEFDIYFEEDCMEDIENFDILAWWKAHAEKFPVLSVMARNFLAIPLSVVSSESAFILGGRILDESRSPLNAEMFEALVCGKDWLFKEKDADNEGSVSLHTVPVILPHQFYRMSLDGSLVGARIKVWWPGDKRYYNGVVESFDPGSKMHKVAYDDGGVEVLRLCKEKWDFISEDKGASVASQTVPKSWEKKAAGKNKPSRFSSDSAGKLTKRSAKDEVKSSVKKAREAESPKKPQKSSLKQQKDKTLSEEDPAKDLSLKLPHSSKNKCLDRSLVGARIKVWWPGDKRYYNGVVESFDSGSKRHKVAYDDGDVELLLLSDEQWDYITEDKGASVASQIPRGRKRKGDAVKEENTETPKSDAVDPLKIRGCPKGVRFTNGAPNDNSSGTPSTKGKAASRDVNDMPETGPNLKNEVGKTSVDKASEQMVRHQQMLVQERSPEGRLEVLADMVLLVNGSAP